MKYKKTGQLLIVFTFALFIAPVSETRANNCHETFNHAAESVNPVLRIRDRLNRLQKTYRNRKDDMPSETSDPKYMTILDELCNMNRELIELTERFKYRSRLVSKKFDDAVVECTGSNQDAADHNAFVFLDYSLNTNKNLREFKKRKDFCAQYGF